jgi:glyoxylase-like metal-dependent hydrolase (beta-lactamase superfamily II)
MPNTFAIGDLQVTAVSDGQVVFNPTEYFTSSTAAQWEPHARWLDHEGRLTFPFGCFVVRSGKRTVLVDAGLGPIEFGPYRGGSLLAQLSDAGIQPAEIDVVFITHLHADHCGSAALKADDGVMRPTFPNATYRWTAAEEAYWKGGELPPGSVARKDVFAAVAHRFEAADGGTSLAPGIDVVAMPGHTPGHAAVVLSSGDARAFLLGDGISCPAQLEETEWSGLGDIDPKLARRSQEALAREAEATGALVGASHFPGLTFGRVLTGEGRRYWQPL